MHGARSEEVHRRLLPRKKEKATRMPWADDPSNGATFVWPLPLPLLCTQLVISVSFILGNSNEVFLLFVLCLFCFVLFYGDGSE